MSFYKHITSKLDYWRVNSDFYRGEKGECIGWPPVHSFCEVFDDKIELYVGEGSGEDTQDYKTRLEVYYDVVEFCDRLERLFFTEDYTKDDTGH